MPYVSGGHIALVCIVGFAGLGLMLILISNQIAHVQKILISLIKSNHAD